MRCAPRLTVAGTDAVTRPRRSPRCRLQSAPRAVVQRQTTSTSCNSHSGLGAALSRISEPEHPWRELSDALQRLPGVDTVAIFIVDEPQHRLVVARTSGTHARRLEGLSMAVGDRISGWVAATGQPMINAEAGLDLFDVSAHGAACRHRRSVFRAGGSQGRPDAVFSKAGRVLVAASSAASCGRIVCAIDREPATPGSSASVARTPQVRWRQRTRRSGLPQRSAVTCDTRP